MKGCGREKRGVFSNTALFRMGNGSESDWRVMMSHAIWELNFSVF